MFRPFGNLRQEGEHVVWEARGEVIGVRGTLEMIPASGVEITPASAALVALGEISVSMELVVRKADGGLVRLS